MPKPKKTKRLGGKFAALKATLRSRETEITKLTAKVSTLEKALADTDSRLSEARRRTLPMSYMPGADELNFLPIYIKQVDIKHHTAEFESWDGSRGLVVTGAEATMVVAGDIVHLPGVKK